MRGEPVVLKEFDGHYPQTADGRIPDNGFRNLQNMLVTNKGTLRTRVGFRRETGTTTYDSGTMLGLWTTAAGIYRLVATHASGVSLFDSAAGDIDTPTAIEAQLLLQFSDKAYLFREVTTNIRTWDDTTLTTTSVAVNANVGIVHKHRMFVANNASSGVSRSQLRYSEIMDAVSPDTVGGWPSTNTIDIGSEDADFITAVALLNDTLFVFKRFSTWVVYVEGDPSWTVRQVHPTLGCVGRDTVVSIGGLLYFRSATGVYRTDGTTFELISLPVKEVFDAQPPFSYLFCNNRSAVWHGEYYIINDGFTTGWQVYNIETGAWSNFLATISHSRLISLEDFSPPRTMFLEYSSTGRVNKYEELNGYGDLDGSTAVNGVLDAKEYDLDASANYKQVREVNVEISQVSSASYGVTFSQFNENGSQLVYGNSFQTVDGVNRKLYRYRGIGKCRIWSFLMLVPCTHDVEINQILIDVKPVGRVGVAN
jgi:hypothetical protein